LKVDLYCP